MVASLREGSAPLDMPPELATALLPLEAGRSDGANKAGREQSLLIGQVVDEKGCEALADLYDRLAGPDLAAVALDLGQRFDQLGAGTDEDEIADLASAYIEHLGPWMHEFNKIMAEFADADIGMLLRTHATETTTPQQRRLLSEIGLRLGKQAAP